MSSFTDEDFYSGAFDQVLAAADNLVAQRENSCAHCPSRQFVRCQGGQPSCQAFTRDQSPLKSCHQQLHGVSLPQPRGSTWADTYPNSCSCNAAPGLVLIWDSQPTKRAHSAVPMQYCCVKANLALSQSKPGAGQQSAQTQPRLRPKQHQHRLLHHLFQPSAAL
jgi:hypothetical protein